MAQQLDDVDTRGLTSGIQNPGSSKGASLRTAQQGAETPRQPTSKSAATNPSPSELRTQALLKQALSRLESKIVSLLDSTCDATSRMEARLFLSVFVTQRSTILGYLKSTPSDVSLRDSLIEYTDFVENSVSTLEPGSLVALEIVATSLRERYSSLILFGVSAPSLKQKIKAVQQAIAPDSTVKHSELVAQLYQCLTSFHQLESQAGAPPKSSLLYELLR